MLNRTFLVYTSGLEIVGQRTAFVATDLSAAEAFPTVRARRRRGRPDLKRAAIAVVDFSRKMEVLFLRFYSIPFAVLRGGLTFSKHCGSKDGGRVKQVLNALTLRCTKFRCYLGDSLTRVFYFALLLGKIHFALLNYGIITISPKICFVIP